MTSVSEVKSAVTASAQYGRSSAAAMVQAQGEMEQQRAGLMAAMDGTAQSEVEAMIAHLTQMIDKLSDMQNGASAVADKSEEVAGRL